MPGPTRLAGAYLITGLLLGGCGATDEGAQPAISDTVVEIAPAPIPTVLAGQTGTREDVTVTQDDIARARQTLAADNGFIVVIAPTVETDYHFSVLRAARQRAEDLNLPVEAHSADVTPARAVALIDDALRRGAKAIILSVFDPIIRDAVERAIEQDVWVVQYAGRTAGDLGALTISVDDAELGRVAGDYTGQLIVQEFGGRASVAILDFPDAPQVVIRAKSIRAALLAAAPQAVIVGNFKGGTTEFGYESMTVALEMFPEINVVVSINDAGAYGAYQVLDAAGRTRADSIVVGIDGETQARELIEARSFYRATVDTAPQTTGQMAIDAVIKLLVGGTLPQHIRVPVHLISTADLP